MTQQVSSHIVENHPVTEQKSVCAVQGDKVIFKTVAGTLRYHKDRFAQWGTCNCPEEFLESVEPLNCGVKIISCPICQKEKEQFYS